VCNLDSDLLIRVFVNIFKVSAQDAALGEHLGAMRAGVWLMTGVLSQMNLHVAALGEGATTVINQALEEPLMPVRLWVEYSNSLTHILGDGFEALFAL